jgi:hypothetical protein
MVTIRTANSAFSTFTEYNNNNTYNKNNIREYNIVHGDSIQVGKHCYLVCIPDLPTGTTKMEVARAVERRILYSSIGEIQYVKNVVVVEGFDEESKNAIENSCYKIAIVNVEMTPNEHGVYTDYENDFYESVCRGDILIGEWSNAFLMANPNYYFKSVEAAAAAAAAEEAKAVVAAQTDAAFQKWKHGAEIERYKFKVEQDEREICDLQNTVNELLESLRFLSRKRSGEGLLGLKDGSKSLSSFMSTLNNKYARICVADVEFLEINKNMKLKMLLGLVVNLCDDCDACQELIHSLDYIGDEERRRDLFVQIEKLICRINHSVRKFQRLHLHAERCIFGLRNRAVFTEFASFLNTAVEIVEEVTSRNCTHAQDVDFVKCYGIRATSKQEQQQAADNGAWGGADGSCVGDYGGSWDGSHDGYGGIIVNNNHYDYYENADNVETDDADADADADEETASVSQMLAEFDAMRALTANATADSVVVEDTVAAEVEKQQVVVIANDQEQTEEVELVMTATAVKEEQREEKEKETNKSSSSNGDNDVNQNKPKGKWFSWF